MFMFSIQTTSNVGVKVLQLKGASSEAVGRLALTVAASRGWFGASVLETVRLYRVQY